MRARERKVAELRTLRVLFLFSAKRESRSEKEERKVRLSERLDRASGSTQTFSPGGLGSLSSERLFSINLLSARPESDGPAHRPPQGQAEGTRAPRAHRVSRGRKEGRREEKGERRDRKRERTETIDAPQPLPLPPLSKKKTRTPAASTTPARPPPPPPSPAATPPPSPPRSASRSGRSATNALGPASTSGTSEGRGRCGPFGETTSKRPTGSSGSSTLPTGRDCETARSS